MTTNLGYVERVTVESSSPRTCSKASMTAICL